MQVSRRSWHFRLYISLVSMWSEGPDFFKGARSKHQPKNLCRYFWTVVVMLLLTPIWSVLALAATIGVLILFAGIIIWEELFEDRWARRKAKRAAKRKERLRIRAERDEVERTPGLFRSYLKARKEKVCPLIQLVD